ILPLPWALAAHLPLLRFALPQRFTMFVWLALALAAARWLDRTSVPAWRSYGIVALSAVFLLPNLADPLLHRQVRIPEVFRDPALARQLAPNGGSLLILDRAKGEDMLWQAEDSFAFSMPQGHTGTEPLPFRHDPVWHAIKYEEPQGLVPDQPAGFLRAHEVVAVLVDPSVLGVWSPLLARLGLHGYRNRQITIYPVSPASPGGDRPVGTRSPGEDAARLRRPAGRSDRRAVRAPPARSAGTARAHGGPGRFGPSSQRRPSPRPRAPRRRARLPSGGRAVPARRAPATRAAG